MDALFFMEFLYPRSRLFHLFSICLGVSASPNSSFTRSASFLQSICFVLKIRKMPFSEHGEIAHSRQWALLQQNRNGCRMNIRRHRGSVSMFSGEGFSCSSYPSAVGYGDEKLLTSAPGLQNEMYAKFLRLFHCKHTFLKYPYCFRQQS